MPPGFAVSIRKPIELPVLVAKAFIEDLRAFFAEKGAKTRRDRGPEQIHAHLPHR